MASKKKPQLAQSEVIQDMPLACVDETAARKVIERDRWGDHPYCPHCGETNVYRMTGEKAEKRGLLRCHGCKKQFTVRVGSIFEDSKIPLSIWCRALWEASSCKNGISALELSRKIQVSYKTALFMMHRIRHAMADSPENPPQPLGGIVEMDETYVGGKPRYKGKVKGRSINATGRGCDKIPVMAIVERGGDVRTQIIASVTAGTISKMLKKHVQPGANILTDEFLSYRRVCREHGNHLRVNHSRGEYVNPVNHEIHTNTIEGFFSRVKRGLNGTYHAVSPEHLHRYLNQFAFAYNTRELNDGERLSALIHRTGGKRLLYRKPKAAA